MHVNDVIALNMGQAPAGRGSFAKTEAPIKQNRPTEPKHLVLDHYNRDRQYGFIALMSYDCSVFAEPFY